MKLLDIINKVFKNIFIALVLAILVGLGIYLFFGEKIIFYLNNNGFNSTHEIRQDHEVLSIGYSFAPIDLDPIKFNFVTRSHLVDIYEGLVATDRDLHIKSGLAVSWGLVDPLVWEFRLRPGVKFHDGSELGTYDVISSIENAINGSGSQLKDLLNTIESVTEKDGNTVVIKTSVPDPLLLNKLSITYIYPSGTHIINNPIGTGPYKYVKRDKSEMELERNELYWGPPAAFKKVVLKVISKRRERLEALESGKINMLANFPPSAACSLIDEFKNAEGCENINMNSIQVKSIPSLEVSFLMMNLGEEIFKEKEIREALVQSFDSEVFRNIAFGFAKPANQFVSSGVFGFNPKIVDKEFNIEKARKMVEQKIGSSFDRIVVDFVYPETLEPIGQYVRGQLFELGLDVNLKPVSDEYLQDSILHGSEDLYFLGWKSELGDASDFLQAVAHSRENEKGYGGFNGIGYSNSAVDLLIEKSQENLEQEKRVVQMQEAMRIIVEDDIIGIPLFESETIFAFSDDIKFEPRVDGYIYASEIK